VRIYVDNQSMYTVNAASIDQTLTLKPGAHYVVMQAWNQAGAVAKTPLNITVQNAAPVATLVVTPSNAMAPAVVSASATGTDSDGSIAATSINFGDGAVMNSTSATHIYSLPGTYTVTAKVTDDSGATSIATRTVTVVPLGITVTRPSRGSTVSNPVPISAIAAATVPIVAMRVYVDSVPVYSLNSFSSKVATLDTAVSMTRGGHNIVVQAWDAAGKVYKTPLAITVQ
jgi:PKD repeat protein